MWYNSLVVAGREGGFHGDRCGLFTLHGNGTGTGTGNRTEMFRLSKPGKGTSTNVCWSSCLYLSWYRSLAVWTSHYLLQALCFHCGSFFFMSRTASLCPPASQLVLAVCQSVVLGNRVKTTPASAIFKPLVKKVKKYCQNLVQWEILLFEGDNWVFQWLPCSELIWWTFCIILSIFLLALMVHTWSNLRKLCLILRKKLKLKLDKTNQIKIQMGMDP